MAIWKLQIETLKKEREKAMPEIMRLSDKEEREETGRGERREKGWKDAPNLQAEAQDAGQ